MMGWLFALLRDDISYESLFFRQYALHVSTSGSKNSLGEKWEKF